MLFGRGVVRRLLGLRRGSGRPWYASPGQRREPAAGRTEQGEERDRCEHEGGLPRPGRVYRAGCTSGGRETQIRVGPKGVPRSSPGVRTRRRNRYTINRPLAWP